MYNHCFAKFSQNKHLKDYIVGTGDRSVVEASPSDFIWGIGLDEEAARQQAPETWPGLNLLGKVLERVRDDLRRVEK